MMAAASSACCTRFAAPSAFQAPWKACESHKVSSFLAPFTPHCRELHAGRHGLLQFPSSGFCKRFSACAGKQVGALQEGGAQIPRRQLVLQSAGVLVAAAAGGLDKPAVATAVSSANLVQPPASVLVIGAGGATGGRIVRELLKKGYSVKAGVRDIEKAKV
jgi:hypothetical protein